MEISLKYLSLNGKKDVRLFGHVLLSTKLSKCLVTHTHTKKNKKKSNNFQNDENPSIVNY